MPCDTKLRVNQTAEERRRAVLASLRKLEAALSGKTARVVIGPQGAIAFVGWGDTDRDGVTDVCAFRGLTALKSHALARAVAEAEVRAGRKVDVRAVAQGVHSHDGGATWGRH